jgi:predicted amidohydrolase YtcJ
MKYIYLFAAFILFANFGKAPKATLVLLNGNVVTLKSKGDRAQAVAIKDGDIIATGSDDAIRNYIGADTKVIDLKGKTVLPGFNDVHMHPAAIYDFDKPWAVLKLDTVSSMKNLIALL